MQLGCLQTLDQVHTQLNQTHIHTIHTITDALPSEARRSSRWQPWAAAAGVMQPSTTHHATLWTGFTCQGTSIQNHRQQVHDMHAAPFSSSIHGLPPGVSVRAFTQHSGNSCVATATHFVSTSTMS